MNEDKRKEARQRADRLREAYEAEGQPLLWFEALYKEAQGDAELIPWGGVGNKEGAAGIDDQERTAQPNGGWQHGQARLPLVNWLAELDASDTRGKALDVGCGLGHNAAALQKAGFEVTAFDIAPTAVEWAAKIYSDLPITWEVANLLELPEAWTAQFDLVSETFTIQALVGEEREQAFAALSKLVAPGGRLLIVCRGRLEDEEANPPPWPLTPDELDHFHSYGFRSVKRAEYFDDRDPPNRHFVAEFRRL